ncbi:hypothetical protein PoB_003575700 [Plakobranchus ocellatus]|uniref:Uncharacterized protein n=1 Tax=Plakobranchus ocellatus TaxID=259542 RepID=A0AAV4AQN8_9GAST|nr:hypothetical protein PoB_003575700 [Plakobranchus ocellatus]
MVSIDNAAAAVAAAAAAADDDDDHHDDDEDDDDEDIDDDDDDDGDGYLKSGIRFNQWLNLDKENYEFLVKASMFPILRKQRFLTILSRQGFERRNQILPVSKHTKARGEH